MSNSPTALAVQPTIDAILRWNEGRKPEILRRKFERMGEDLFAFFRRTDHLFADAWTGLDAMPVR